jgi:hypothetical protein
MVNIANPPMETINGSLGMLFLSRSIRFNYQEETEVVGVSAYKFVLDETLTANASTNPSNWCFNPNPDVLQVGPWRSWERFFISTN